MENRSQAFISQPRCHRMEWANPDVSSPSPTEVSPDRVRRPSDLEAIVCLEVYASLELQPTLGAGEQLRELTMTMEQLLDYSAKDARE